MSLSKEEDIPFLAEFINPVYLQARTMRTLASHFINESSLELHSFLNNPSPQFSNIFYDNRDGLGSKRAGTIPSHTTGTTAGWSIKGPPHTWRYCTLNPPEGGMKSAVCPRSHTPDLDEIMRSLQNELFPSPAFRTWLAVISMILPLRYAVEARRFRLDVILGEQGKPEEKSVEEPQVGVGIVIWH